MRGHVLDLRSMILVVMVGPLRGSTINRQINHCSHLKLWGDFLSVYIYVHAYMFLDFKHYKYGV